MLDRPKLTPINPKFSKKKLLGFFLVLPALYVLISVYPFGFLESRFFPFVSKARVLAAKELDEGVWFTVNFDVKRNCDLLSVDWYLGNHTRKQMIPLRPTGSNKRTPQSLSIGNYTTGPWLLEGISLHEFRHHVTSRVRSFCHPFWTSISEFY